MKRRQFLWSVAAGGTSLLSATGAAVAGVTVVGSALATQLEGSSRASSQSLLLRLDSLFGYEEHGACAWQPHAASCTSTATRWRMTMHGLVLANTSALQAMRIDARYTDGKGGTHRHALFRFDQRAFDSHSKPVGFSFTAGALRSLEIEQEGRDSDSCSSNCQIDGRLMPGIYALITSPSSCRIDIGNLDYSGQKNEPLRRRDGQPLALDYIAFEIAEDA